MLNPPPYVNVEYANTDTTHIETTTQDVEGELENTPPPKVGEDEATRETRTNGHGR
jgi:hypothetical protein